MASIQLLTVLLIAALSCSLHTTHALKIQKGPRVEEIFEGLPIAKSNAQLTLEPHKARHKRAVTATTVYDESEREDSVESHNLYRAQVTNAADMNYIEWDADLANQAQEWANKCKFDHGFDTSSAVSAKFSQVGQNLFMTTAPSYPDEGYVVRAWYNEVSYYTYDTMTCQAGKVCGHYTQVIWSTLTHVGCGKKTCANLVSDEDNTSWQNAIIVVCNSGPGGNVVGVKPYIVGSPCTECATGSYRCWEGKLCRGTCPDDDCTCDVDCNCGTRNDTACTCSCQDGWTGGRCCKPCDNYHSNCNNGWWAPNCGAASYIPTSCPKMCSVCNTGGSCTLTSDKQCLVPGDSSLTTTTASSGGGGNAGSTASSGSTTASSGGGAGSTASSGSTTASSGGGAGTTQSSTSAGGAGSPSTPSSAQSTAVQSGTSTTQSMQGSTSTTTAASTTTAVQEVQDAQANAGVMFELGGSLQQWPVIWTTLNGVLVSAINDACNSPNYYTQCCPDAGAQGSSYAVYVEPETVQVASGYPIEATSASGSIQVIIFAEPVANNTLCTPPSGASSGRRKRSVQGEIFNDILLRVRRNALPSFNFMPQEVLYAAVQQSSDNITTTLVACCNVTVAAVSKSKAIVTTVPPSTSAFPDWAIAVVVIASVAMVGVIVGVIVYLATKKPNKTANVDSRYVTHRQTHSETPRTTTTTISRSSAYATTPVQTMADGGATHNGVAEVDS